jgi:hypothetical protein
VTLTGAALGHENSNDVSNLSIALQASAFALGNAADVSDTARTNLLIDFRDAPRQPVVCQLKAASTERVGFNNIRSRVDVIPMNFSDQIWICEVELVKAGIDVYPLFVEVCSNSPIEYDHLILQPLAK